MTRILILLLLGVVAVAAAIGHAVAGSAGLTGAVGALLGAALVILFAALM